MRFTQSLIGVLLFSQIAPAVLTTHNARLFGLKSPITKSRRSILPGIASDIRKRSHKQHQQKCGVSKYGCNAHNRHSRIHGGSTVKPNALPWQVRLKIYESKHSTKPFVCGGSIYDEKHVITAAHCLLKDATYKVEVITGDHDKWNSDENERRRTAYYSSIFLHPDFDYGSGGCGGGRPSLTCDVNDIAIIKLGRAIRFNEDVMPVCIPEEEDDVKIGEQTIVAGWGQMVSGRQSSHLKSVSVPVIDRDQCERKLRIRIDEKQICAGGEYGEDSCKGDSGGPMMRKKKDCSYEQIGIVSWGLQCGRRDFPGVYTRLSMFLPWIRRVVKDGDGGGRSSSSEESGGSWYNGWSRKGSDASSKPSDQFTLLRLIQQLFQFLQNKHKTF